MIAVGGIDGRVEFWNTDSRNKAYDLVPNLGNSDEEISTIKFEPGTLNVAVGTQRGKVFLYDMRYPVPMQTLTHHYRLPIKNIKYHPGSRKILTCDKKIIKIYDKHDGSLFTNIEPKNEINDIELCGNDTGLIFAP